jgi:hypothetical protein
MGKKIGAALSAGESGPDFNSVDDVAKMKARLKKSYPQPFSWPLTGIDLGSDAKE